MQRKKLFKDKFYLKNNYNYYNIIYKNNNENKKKHKQNISMYK